MLSDLQTILSWVAGPTLILAILEFLRWYKTRRREDIILGIFFLAVHFSMSFSVLSQSVCPCLNIAVFASGVFICLAFFVLFLFLVSVEHTLKKYWSFIITYLIFVIYIGVMYINIIASNTALVSDTGEYIQTYNIHPAFGIAVLSYVITWGVVSIYWLYKFSLELSSLAARVKTHFFIIGVAFLLLGILFVKVPQIDPRDLFFLEVSAQFYGVICFIIAFLLFLASFFVPRSMLKLWEAKKYTTDSNISLLKPVNLLIFVLCIALNILGGKISSCFHLPLFMDMIGTALLAIVFGPWYAATGGLLTNLLLSIVSGVFYFPFALCNIAGGLTWGYLFKRGYGKVIGAPAKVFWQKFIKFILLNGILVAVIIATISATISYVLFGGFSGHEAEYIAMEAQKYLGTFGGNYLARLAIESFDKTTAVLVAFFVSILFFGNRTITTLKYDGKLNRVIVDCREPILFELSLLFFGFLTIPLFLLFLHMPENAIVGKIDWIWINIGWVAIVSVAGLVVLWKYAR